MKTLKRIGFGLLALILLLLVIGLFLPSKFDLERSIVINAPKEVIFEQFNVPKNSEKWSPWHEMDPEMKPVYNNIESGKGAGYSWKGPKAGEGELVITNSVPYSLIETDLDFYEHGKASGGYRLEETSDGIKTTWYFSSDVGNNPVARWMMVISKGMMNDMFDQGLQKVKAISESAPKPTSANNKYQIEMTTVNAFPYLAVRDTGSVATIGQKLGMHYGTIMEVMKKQNLEHAGQPFAIYYTDSETNWEFDACIPVNKPGKGEGKVAAAEMKAGNAVVAHYFGPYEGTASAHAAIYNYIQENGKQITGRPWEVYVTDPMVEKDVNKVQTDIYYPVE